MKHHQSGWPVRYSRTIHVRDGDFTELSQLMEELPEEARKQVQDKSPVLSRLVLCEELLIEYAENGYTEMEVLLRSFFRHSSILIRIPGEKMEAVGFSEKREHENGEDEIRQSIHAQILKNGRGWTRYRYARNANIYEITLSGDEEALGEKILELYRTRGEEIRKKPILLLWNIVKWDPVRCVGAVLNRVVKRGSLMLVPVCTAVVIDSIVQGEAFFSFRPMFFLLLSVILILVNCLCNYRLDYYFYDKKLREIENGLKSAVLKKLQLMSADYMNSTSFGGIFSKIIRDTEGVRMALFKSVDAVIQIFTDITVILVTTMIDCPVMLAFYAVAVPIAALLLSRYRKPILDSAARLRKTTEHSNAVIRDMQAMWQFTRMHGVNHTEYNLLDSELQNVRRAGNETDLVNHRFNTATFLTFQLFQLLSLAFALYLAFRGFISIGAVVMFRAYFESLVNSVTKFIDVTPEVTQGYESLNSLNEVLCAEDLEADGDYVFTRPINGEIEFRDVTFHHPGAEESVIDHLSFRIPAGKSVAFIGPSGSGKSTIMNLITGLLQKESGEILIDGVEIDRIRKSSYRRQIAVVPQKTVLFAGTLWENLVYGQNYVTHDDVTEVLRRIGLDDVVASLPEGLDSKVTELGSNFSGGQQQRIAIARALLRRPRILLLDEATSALDSESEKQVQRAIDGMMGVCTMIMIAHRLTTVRKCDLIFRLEKGKGITVYNSYDEMMQGEPG